MASLKKVLGHLTSLLKFFMESFLTCWRKCNYNVCDILYLSEQSFSLLDKNPTHVWMVKIIFTIHLTLKHFTNRNILQTTFERNASKVFWHYTNNFITFISKFSQKCLYYRQNWIWKCYTSFSSLHSTKINKTSYSW